MSFIKNNSDDTNPPNLPETEVFKNNVSNNKIDAACYMYNYKNEGIAERLDIAVRGSEEGWIWMMGSKQNYPSSYQKLWFREIILKKEKNKKWKVTLAQEGEIESFPLTGYGLQMNKLNTFHSHINVIWLDTHVLTPCTRGGHNCDLGSKQKSMNLYWKPNDKLKKKLSELSLNTGHQITRWSNYKNSINTNRRRFYKDGKWYINKEYTSLIKLNDNDVSNTRGKWENLHGLCDIKNIEKEKTAFETYCR